MHIFGWLVIFFIAEQASHFIGVLIAQIAPVSFQTSIPHKHQQVKWGEVHALVVTEWPPACLHKLLTRISQLNQYLSYKPH